MNTAHFSSSGGGSAHPPDADFPLPWMQTPPLPGCRLLSPSHVTCDACWEAKSPQCWSSGHVTCDACWEANFPSVNRMTERCKNITLPQTLFRGGNKFFIQLLAG